MVFSLCRKVPGGGGGGKLRRTIELNSTGFPPLAHVPFTKRLKLSSKVLPDSVCNVTLDFSSLCPN